MCGGGQVDGPFSPSTRPLPPSYSKGLICATTTLFTQQQQQQQKSLTRNVPNMKLRVKAVQEFHSKTIRVFVEKLNISHFDISFRLILAF